MTPGKFDLNLYRGDSYTWRFTLWQDAGQTIVSDLTGVTAAAEIRDKSAGDHVVALNCVVIMPNQIEVSITPAMYADCPSKGVWDLQLTYPGQDVKTPIAGAVTVTADVTDSVAMAAMAAKAKR